jgi:hypothetical protein
VADILRYLKTTAFRKIVIWTSDLSKDVDTSPTITSGSGAPSAAEPNGSIYLRTDGTNATTLYVRAAGAWTANGIT